ncbi:MAG: cation transporter [Endomicrobiales bacterium]|nr:cation transporter [Endomicrobiales bacterium]
MSRKTNVAKLSIMSNTALILLKFAVGIFTGAVSIISEAIHSTMDLAAAIVAYISVRVSDKPPDESHPYGHEKAENISGVIEAVLIIIAAFVILVEAAKKLARSSEVESVGLGFAVMVVSAVINVVVSAKLYKVAKEEESIAIEADALHLKADVLTSIGVAAGLLVIWIWDWHIIDPIAAILIALMILKEACELLKRSFSPLMDANLSDEEVGRIKEIIGSHNGLFLDFHELRTRRSGKIKHIDLHMTIPSGMTVKEFHDLSDHIEQDIEKILSNTKVLVHSEPCDDNCPACAFLKNCKYKR